MHDIMGLSYKTHKPLEIGQLQALTTLDLSHCWSLTELPKEIGRLQALIPLP